MKHFVLFFFCIVFISSKTSAQYSWQALSNAPKSYRLDDIYFLNPNLGWAISPSYTIESPTKFGQIYRTTNGGTTWELQKDSSLTYYRSVGFADSLTGWVGNLGDTSRVNNIPTTPDTISFYHTVNGGFTWLPVLNIPSPKPKGICGISVVTDSVVYAYGRYFGPPVLLKTTDKGTSWTSHDMSTYASGLIDGYFFNKDTGFVSGSSPGKQATILSTFDGGKSWQTRYLSTRSDTDGVWKLSFPSRKIGYASVEHWAASPTFKSYFLKTTDGGLTWTEHQFVNSYDLQGIGFINDSTGWIGGWYETNFKTTNGGKTWNWDLNFGAVTAPYNYSGYYNVNRFRRFGDTLMYASGNTVYKLRVSPTGINEQDNTIQQVENFPNPFSDQTTLSYSLSSAESMTVSIYDVLGECVFSNSLGLQNPGVHQFTLQVNLPSGIYYCVMSSEKNRLTKKITIEK